MTLGDREQTIIRLKRSGLFSKYREILDTICLLVDPIKRNTLIFSCTSSNCIRSLNCNTASCGCFSLQIWISFQFIYIFMFALNGAYWPTKVHYHNGWFFAIFIVFSSSNFIELMRVKDTFGLLFGDLTPFAISSISRCKVFSWKITNWPHFVISTSNSTLRHDCATHYQWKEIKIEKIITTHFFIYYIKENKIPLKTCLNNIS